MQHEVDNIARAHQLLKSAMDNITEAMSLLDQSGIMVLEVTPKCIYYDNQYDQILVLTGLNTLSQNLGSPIFKNKDEHGMCTFMLKDGIKYYRHEI